MTDRELMQDALDALTYVGDAKEIYSHTIKALRARLAQPEGPDWSAAGFGKPSKREWQGLTTQEIADETDIATSSNKDIFDLRKAFWCGASWAEAKLKEKNFECGK